MFKKLPSLLVAVFTALIFRWGVAEAYVIPTGSMQPTLLIHDHIFVNKMIYGLRVPFSKKWFFHAREPARGEVIVFKDPRANQTFLIKRVVGVPGDNVAYHDGRLFVNGALVHEEPVATAGRGDFRWLRDQDLEDSRAVHRFGIENLGGHVHGVLHLQGAYDREQRPLTVPPGTLFVMGDHRDNSADSRYWGFAPQENILGRASFVWLSCEKGLLGTAVGCDPTTVRWRRLFHRVI